MKTTINQLPMDFTDRQNPDYFVKAPKIILYAGKKISDGAKLLYFILRDYGRNGRINPSVQRLAADMEKSERQIQNLLRELEDAKIIRRAPAYNQPNNIILLNLKPQPVEAEKEEGQAAAADQPQPPTSRSRRPAAAADQKKTEGEKNFAQGVKKIAPKEDGFKEIHVCVKTPLDNENQSVKGTEGIPIIIRVNSNDKTDEGKTVKTEVSDLSKSRVSTGYIALIVALRKIGISEQAAARLATIAAANHGDSAEQFITYWSTRAITGRKIDDPCAYLSAAITENWQPGQRSRDRQPAATGNQPRPATSRKPQIDLTGKYAPGGKYGNISNTVTGRPCAL